MSNEHNNPPVTCGNGCDCLAQCGDTYAHAGLPKPPETEKAAPAPAVPLGYINAGHLHEMQSGRLPYAYLYAAPGVGVEIPVYTSNAPTVPQGWTFSVSDDDDGAWLRVKSPGGREAAFSAVNGGLAHDNRRSIASRVLLELKEALAATPAPAPAVPQGEPVGVVYSFPSGDGNTAWGFKPNDSAWEVEKQPKSYERRFNVYLQATAPPQPAVPQGWKLVEMDDIKTGLNAALANVQAPAPTVPRGEAWGYVDHRGCAIKFKNARHRSELANAIECGGLEYLYTSPAEKLGNDIESALESLVERCNNDAGMSNEDAVIHAEAVLERVYNSRSATPAPAPADGRGTDAQIQKERDIARHAIVGALAAGYAGQAHPGADHWLAAAHDAGVRIKSLEAPAPAQTIGRTELEIVEQTEEIAAFLMDWRWGQEPESPSVKFRSTENVKAQKCRAAACHIQEMITATDVENAVAEVDDGPEPDAAPAQEVTLTLAAEDVHAAFAKNFPKSRISQAWISFAADIAQAIAARAAKPAQEVGLTEAERVRCLIASGCIGTVKMTYDSGPYEITRTSINASRLIDAIIAALRAKGGKL